MSPEINNTNNPADQARSQKETLIEDLITIRDNIRLTREKLENLIQQEQERGRELHAIDRRILELDYKLPSARQD